MDKQVFNTDIFTSYAANKEGGVLGLLRWQNNKCFRWVRNDTTVDTVAGRVYYGGAAAAVNEFDGTAYTFGQAAKSTDIDWPLGVSAGIILAGQFGWLQCYGEIAALGVEGTVAVAIGDSLIGVSGQTYMVKEAVVTAGTANPAMRKAFALAAQGAGGVAATRAYLLML